MVGKGVSHASSVQNECSSGRGGWMGEVDLAVCFSCL